MKRLTAILIGVAAAVVALGPAVAWAQYRTPLRYDLRYTSPTYIPSGTLRRGPPRQADPYRFGNPLYGNLAVTGNLRLGKSFRGNTPYTASGSQLSRDLPSTRLSDFRRDSIGIADLGTGLEYGGIQPYYSDMATVTTPWTAGRRFDSERFRDRIRYLPPNYNVPPTEPVRTPGNVFSGPGGWTGLTMEDVQAAAEGGYSLGAPQTTEDVLASLRAASRGWLPAEEGQGRMGVPGTDEQDDPLKYPYEVFQKQFQTEPVNLFDAEPAPGEQVEESAFERTMKLQYAPGAVDLDTWVQPAPEEDEPADEQRGRAREDDAAGDRWTTGQGWLDQDQPDAADPWAGFDTADPVRDVEGLQGEAGRRRPGPVPTAITSGYGRYVLLGHAALRQGQYGKAESLYAAAAALERDRPAAFFGRVHALLASRLYLQAAIVLKRGLTEHPEWAKHAPDLEAVYPKDDVFSRIRRDLKREVDRGTVRAGYRFLLAYVEFATGNADEARPYLTQAAEASGAEKAMLEAIGPE